jgi:phage shock protein A
MNLTEAKEKLEAELKEAELKITELKEDVAEIKAQLKTIDKAIKMTESIKI